MVLNGLSIENGTKIKFRTLATSDPVLWVGTVEGIVNYPVARMVSDVAAMHAEVVKDVPELIPATEMEYIILATSDTLDPSIKVAFGKDWIDEGTVQVIEVGNTIGISVFNEPDSSIPTILQLLAEHGYKAKLTS